MSTRRQFLTSSTALCALAALPRHLLAERLGGQVFTNASVGAYAQGLLTKARFETLVGSTFTVFLENNEVAYLTLQAVTAAQYAAAATLPSSGAPPEGGRSNVRILRPEQSDQDSFVLNFSSGGKVVPQSSYLVDHGTLGRFAVFLVPGTDPAGNSVCNASFNYLPSYQLIVTDPPVSLRQPTPLRRSSAPVPGGNARGGVIRGRAIVENLRMELPSSN